jgi:lysophospholipase L1-like esterase
MRYVLICLLAGVLRAQSTPKPPEPQTTPVSAVLGQKEAEQLATRMLQLMESTAVAVPGLVRASEPVKQNAEMTLTAMQRAPRSPVLTYQFMNQVRAYLALSDSIPRPYPFPAVADQQYVELHECLQRMQQHFEAILPLQNQPAQSPAAVPQPVAAKPAVVQSPPAQAAPTQTARIAPPPVTKPTSVPGEPAPIVDARPGSDPDDKRRYAEDDSKIMHSGKFPNVILLGDSSTSGWDLDASFAGRNFVNRGIAGQATNQILARFQQDVGALHPKAVVIMAGTNDIAKGMAANQIQEDLMMMGDLAKARGIKPLFASVLPVGGENAKTRPRAMIEQINRWIENYCKSEGFTFINYYSVMADPGGQMKADLSDDGLDPNAKGYSVMSPVLLEAIGRALPGADTPKPPSPRPPGK